MKESLKEKLTQYLKAQSGRVIPFNVVELLVKQWGYKVSNMERRLRDSESPNIEKIKNDKGVITGYRYRTTIEPETSRPALNLQPQTTQRTIVHRIEDCPSYKFFKIYCKECATKQLPLVREEVKTNTLF